MWTRQLSIQLHLAHIAEKYKKEETKTNKCQCPFNSVLVLHEKARTAIYRLLSVSIVLQYLSYHYYSINHKQKRNSYV